MRKATPIVSSFDLNSTILPGSLGRWGTRTHGSNALRKPKRAAKLSRVGLSPSNGAKWLRGLWEYIVAAVYHGYELMRFGTYSVHGLDVA